MAQLQSRRDSSSSQERRTTKYGLNVIVEESEDEGEYSYVPPRPFRDSRSTPAARPSPSFYRDQERDFGAAVQQDSRSKVDLWLSPSPMSDHFPTPRGFHYLAAPIFPPSPSTESPNAYSPYAGNEESDNASCVGTDSTEFEDCDDDHVRSAAPEPSAGLHSPLLSPRHLPPLIIPGRFPATSRALQSTGTPLSSPDKRSWISPVTHVSSAVQLSPEAIEMLERQQALDVPDISAPPSLDGSLDSEQMTELSSPPTPILGPSDGSPDGDDEMPPWGVRLEPAALETLLTLSSDDEGEEAEPQQTVLDMLPDEEDSQPMVETASHAPLQILFGSNMHGNGASAPARRPSSATAISVSESTNHDLRRLEIPSPHTFFAALAGGTGTTWDPVSPTTIDNESVNSAAAERFYSAWDPCAAPAAGNGFSYRRVWGQTSPVEQVVEIPYAGGEEGEDDLTAKPQLTAILKPAASPHTIIEDGQSPVEETMAITLDCAPPPPLSNRDRMEAWLSAQRAFLPALPDEPEGVGGDEDTLSRPRSTEAGETALATLARTRSVRFSEPTAGPCRLPSKLFRQESAYYRAFMAYIVRQHAQDALVHRQPRFEALQAQRTSLAESHRNQLLGKFQLSVVPQSLMKRLSANVARGDADLLDDPEKLRREKEHEALEQMSMALWHVGATRALNGGKLIRSPVARRLARLSLMEPGPDGLARDRARILDLGGQGTCDWAWHCAHQYPNTKVYTVTTKAIRQMSNSNIRGPPNHRQVAVQKLSRLPFRDGQFDLISARELYGILKVSGEHGEDEWESCLRECMRVLKPGGYLEFSILDSDMINPGPLGLARSVEFGFTLKTLGYDPTPTKGFVGRLARAGFECIRRAWVCHPMGEKPVSKARAAPRASKSGTTDGIAAVSGLAAGWSWERWLLRCETEKVASELRLADTTTTGETVREASKCLEGVQGIVEEGRACGAAWRMMNGWARKPKPGEAVISITLAE